MVVGAVDRGDRRRRARSSPRAASTRHIHFICPQLVDEAISAGLTTLLGGGTGPATGTNATTCTPGAWNIHRMLEAAEAFPLNLGFLGKGNASAPDPLREQIAAGAVGLKLHEDWGTTPAAIDCALARRRRARRPGRRSTPTRSTRAGFVEDSIARVRGPDDPHLPHRGRRRRPRAGHHPRVRRAERACRPRRTRRCRSRVNTMDEHLDMLMVCHHLIARDPRGSSRSPSRASAPRRSPPRTCCTISARSA